MKVSCVMVVAPCVCASEEGPIIELDFSEDGETITLYIVQKRLYSQSLFMSFPLHWFDPCPKELHLCLYQRSHDLSPIELEERCKDSS